jgi:hypothetical protein
MYIFVDSFLATCVSPLCHFEYGKLHGCNYVIINSTSTPILIEFNEL